MRQKPDDDEQQTTTNPDTDAVIRILTELERVEPIGEEPNPDHAVFAMTRTGVMYADGERQARVAIPADYYGDPSAAARRFRIRYTEAFDQILPRFGPAEWIAVHRFLRASGGLGLLSSVPSVPTAGG